MQQYNLPFLQALAQVLAPAAVVAAYPDFMDVTVEGTVVGTLSVNGPDEWFACTYEPRLSNKGKEPYNHMERHGPFATPSKAVRRLFGADNAAVVEIKTGISAGYQESSFQNATLQDASEVVSFSVATTLDIPAYVQSRGEEAIALYIKAMLSRASTHVPGLDFNVQVGSTEDPED